MASQAPIPSGEDAPCSTVFLASAFVDVSGIQSQPLGRADPLPVVIRTFCG